MTEEKPDPRIVEIVRKKQEGKSYTQIAEDLEVSRKTIYNLRSTDAYMQVVDSLFLDLMADIDKFSQSESYGHQLEALKEKGRMLRALLPSLSVIQHRKDKDEKETHIDTTERRKQKEALIKDIMDKFIPKDRHSDFMKFLESVVQNV